MGVAEDSGEFLARDASSVDDGGARGRVGRVAVVAEQAWVRWGTKLESAMLPFIAHRVFQPDQAEAPLAWVEGRGDGGG